MLPFSPASQAVYPVLFRLLKNKSYFSRLVHSIQRVCILRNEYLISLRRLISLKVYLSPGAPGSHCKGIPVEYPVIVLLKGRHILPVYLLILYIGASVLPYGVMPYEELVAAPSPATVTIFEGSVRPPAPPAEITGILFFTQ